MQPSVEFGDNWVHVFDQTTARDLSAALYDLPGFAFEAHSTDYQPQYALDGLVRTGFAILKVGPELTFALREALYGLDMIATEPTGDARSNLRQAMEEAMLADPRHWQPYYQGDERELGDGRREAGLARSQPIAACVGDQRRLVSFELSY